MLRNAAWPGRRCRRPLLNEVLSLNAQESIYQNLATIPGTLPQ